MASEIGSFYGSDTYKLNSNAVRFKCEAWILEKYFANKLVDFSPDKTKSILSSGKPIKTTLKLSPNGLTIGDKILNKLKANSAPYEHFDFERLVDIYQDRKYTNIVVCVIKSRLPEFNYEIYTYIVRKDNEAVSFEKLFKEIATGEKYFSAKPLEKVYGLNTLRLSEIHPSSLKTARSIHLPATKNAYPLSRSETHYSRSQNNPPSVIHTIKRPIQNNQLGKKNNASEITAKKKFNSSSTQTIKNSYNGNGISSVGSHTAKTYLSKKGLIMADVVSYVESQVDDYEYETKARVLVNKKLFANRINQNNEGIYNERTNSALPVKQQLNSPRNFLTNSQNYFSNQDAMYARVRKKESQTQLLSISDSSSSSENISMRPQAVYNWQTYSNNLNDYTLFNHYNYRYTKQPPVSGNFNSALSKETKNIRSDIYNSNVQPYYL